MSQGTSRIASQRPRAQASPAAESGSFNLLSLPVGILFSGGLVRRPSVCYFYMCQNPCSRRDSSSFPRSFWQIKGLARWLLKCSLAFLGFKELRPVSGTWTIPASPHFSTCEAQLWLNQNSVSGVSVYVTGKTATLSPPFIRNGSGFLRPS